LFDGRAAQTQVGRHLQQVLGDYLGKIAGDADAAHDTGSAPGKLTLVKHWHGLGLTDFDVMTEAVAAYVTEEHEVDADAAGIAAHHIEQTAWTQGRDSQPRLLDRGVVQLLGDARLLDAAGVLVAFDRLPALPPLEPMGPQELALTSGSRLLVRLAPADDPPAAIVALCGDAARWRANILELAKETQAAVLVAHGGDRQGALDDYLGRLRTLGFSSTHAPVDGADLLLALTMLTSPDPFPRIRMRPLHIPPGGSNHAAAEGSPSGA
jgi:hypothetical protein